MPDMGGRAGTEDISPARSWGDEVDGSPTFDGTSVVLGYTPSGGKYTLTAPLIANKITISGTAEVWASQYTVDCFHLQVASGASLTWDGNDASADTGGATVTQGGQTFAGSGGGANGRSTTGAGSAGSGSGGNQLSGTTGGDGGTAGGGNTGGAGNSSASLAALQIRQFRRAGFSNGTARVTNAATTFISPNGAGGGGSGGCNTGTGTATSGGGGGGGFVGHLRCGLLENYGKITARGGNGGNGARTGDGVAGGGGGGAGGALHIEVDQVISEGTIDANGGSGGTGVGTGSANGSAGTNGLVVFLVAGRPG